MVRHLGGQPNFSRLSKVSHGWQCQGTYICVWKQMKSPSDVFLLFTKVVEL